MLLDINDDTMDMSVRVTNRRNSYFDINLDICDSPGAIAGTYRCEVSNKLGSDSANSTIEGNDDS
jgi:hypothetical protein